MDRASLIGLFLGIAAVAGGTLLEGGDLGFILQPAAAAIVFGGTLGATLLSYSLPDIKTAFFSLGDVFFDRDADSHYYINQLVHLSNISRKKGLVAIEPYLSGIEDPFFRNTLALAVDGIGQRLLRETVEEEIFTYEGRRLKQSRVYETAGGFAPTIGIIGAVIGLIHVMQNLSEPSRLGEGIAVAFVSTVYGVGIANLFLLPISKKIRNRMNREILIKRLVLEGVSGIQSGLHPAYLKERLLSFIEKDRDGIA
ncbi:chemotaxis protein PomA [bacterium BMS3Bbin06]|nr:chemotaxis protein PomA [bacterium BMS3Abin08]GBE33871.1 chemotaxis protein PomA [bacterium BMS3Bbin06]HDO34889.1 flagellar motor protein [Nitrospirota bacterium]HDY71148.1 flagellar motor protein [Nitrospirota bacterium]